MNRITKEELSTKKCRELLAARYEKEIKSLKRDCLVHMIGFAVCLLISILSAVVLKAFYIPLFVLPFIAADLVRTVNNVKYADARLKKVLDGEFTIIEDKLIAVGYKELRRYHDGMRVVTEEHMRASGRGHSSRPGDFQTDVLYFEHYGRYEIHERKADAKLTTEPGISFFIVVLKGEEFYPVAAYDSREFFSPVAKSAENVRLTNERCAADLERRYKSNLSWYIYGISTSLCVYSLLLMLALILGVVVSFKNMLTLGAIMSYAWIILLIPLVVLAVYYLLGICYNYKRLKAVRSGCFKVSLDSLARTKANQKRKNLTGLPRVGKYISQDIDAKVTAVQDDKKLVEIPLAVKGWGAGICDTNVMTFDRSGEYETYDDAGIFITSAVGDEFWVVSLDGFDDPPAAVYPVKLYDTYEEIPGFRIL